MSTSPAFAASSFASAVMSPVRSSESSQNTQDSLQGTIQNAVQAAEANLQPNLFFQAIFESMMHGVLILNEKREVVQANSRALSLCRQLSSDSQPISESAFALPDPVWNVCRALLSSRQAFPQSPVIPEEEIELGDETQLKIYAQWLNLAPNRFAGADEARETGAAASYMLVTLEDRTEMLRNLARWDAQRYGLTAREAEVWMLKCQSYSYDEIAAELYISRNTVKKHLKSISLKRDALLEE